MRYVGTRGFTSGVPLTRAIAAGLAPDGGLFVPEHFPEQACADLDTTELASTAERLLAPFFAGDALAPELPAIVAEAFDFPAPLERFREARVLELFHGPTAAFKDFGARFLAACLTRIHGNEPGRLTLLVATSGDTGSAVAAAFHGRPGIDVVVLYPKGLVSPRQEQQLTCWDGNVHTLAVRGTFDDCQRMVKAAFQDPALSNYRFSSANSINIGRLLPQMVYYAASAVRVRRETGERAHFIVPSGNLGNALACLWVRRAGLPIGDVILAHNANRTVVDFLEDGDWRPRASIATLASAMDVGDPSNMERLRDAFPELEDLRAHVSARSVSDAEIRDTIAADYRQHGRTWDPHSATASRVYALLPEELGSRGPWVLVATAHPAKFAEIVEPLIGAPVPVPPALAALLERPRRVTEIEATLDALREFLRKTCSTR